MDVLIVEDVEPMLHLLELVVGGIPGMRISGLAKNGWEARIELSRRRPELVLLDEVLPGESGIDLLNQFHLLGLPVILLTSLGAPDHAIPPPALGRVVKPGWHSIEQDRIRIARELQALLPESS